MRRYQLQAFTVLYLSRSQFRRYSVSAVLSGVWRFSSSLLPAGDVATAPLAPHVVIRGIGTVFLFPHHHHAARAHCFERCVAVFAFCLSSQHCRCCRSVIHAPCHHLRATKMRATMTTAARPVPHLAGLARGSLNLAVLVKRCGCGCCSRACRCFVPRFPTRSRSIDPPARRTYAS